MTEEKQGDRAYSLFAGPFPWSYDPLPPFDENVRCPKCAYDAVNTEHAVEYLPRSKTIPCWPNPLPESACKALTAAGWVTEGGVDFYREKLERKCARCGYSWNEACVPNVEKIDPMAGEL